MYVDDPTNDQAIEFLNIRGSCNFSEPVSELIHTTGYNIWPLFVTVELVKLI